MRALALGQHEKGQHVGVVLGDGGDDSIALANVPLAPGACYEVAGPGGIGRVDNAAALGADEAFQSRARVVEGKGGLGGQLVGAPVDVGVGVAVEVGLGVEGRAQTLGGGRRVEIRQASLVSGVVEQREIETVARAKGIGEGQFVAALGGQGLLEGLRAFEHGLGALEKQRVFCRQPRASGRAYERLSRVGVAHGRIGVFAVRAGKPHGLQGRQAHAAREGGDICIHRGVCRQGLLAEKVVAAGDVRDGTHAALVFTRQRRCSQPLEEGASEEEGWAAQPVDPTAHNLCL